VGTIAGGRTLSERQRFKEPLHLSDDSNSDILHPLILRETGLRQEVDIGSSTEITVLAGLAQISDHGGNRCVFHQQPAGRSAHFGAGCGLGMDNGQGQFWGQKRSCKSERRVYLAFCMR
jgi:hypothetical protein